MHEKNEVVEAVELIRRDLNGLADASRQFDKERADRYLHNWEQIKNVGTPAGVKSSSSAFGSEEFLEMMRIRNNLFQTCVQELTNLAHRLREEGINSD